ncbi:MAG: AAA family ATPase [Anaerolineae bacterium]
MIQTLEIQNFKSIRHLRIDCRRVNVFIGEPNTGKSNILESLGIFSAPFTGDFGDFVRMEEMTDLFYNHNLRDEITIRAGQSSFHLRFNEREGTSKGEMELETFIGAEAVPYNFDFTGRRVSIFPVLSPHNPHKFYRFSPTSQFRRIPASFLLPPYGENLPYLLLVNPELRKSLGDLFAPFNLRLVVGYRGDQLSVQKEVGEVIVSLPYTIVSDTLRRIAFYLAAMETNQESVLILEEPESHAFPYYTKYLAERIALDDSNQYFISTHNPYLLIPLLEKTPAEELAVFVTYFREDQTMVRPIAGKEELEKVLDLDLADIFFNLHLLVDKESWSST